MKAKGHVIRSVAPGSIAEELELSPGDMVLEVNGQPIEDVFDYRFLCQDEYLELLVRDQEGDEVLFEIEKDESEDLGIDFENGLMDDYRSCHNHCVFCFIDQMPPGMRETLYFKDDDSRLSFLQGNYVTLTNMSEEDLDRIIRFRMEPINISVHTMNPELRRRMLHNRHAGTSLEKLDRLYEAGIEMNGQIVLCPGYNDGPELDDTIAKLAAYAPVMQSVSVVPVGLTRFRKGLAPLTPVTKECAARTIDIVERWQREIYPETGLHFIHASDEFYLLAERPIPEEERYDGYLQLANGVGTVRLMRDEFAEALAECAGDEREIEISLATGRLFAPEIRAMTRSLHEKYPGVTVHVYAIRNDFFGEAITVTGLITGQDLIGQLREKPLGSRLLLSVDMLRSGETVFLDDITVAEAEQTLQVPVNIVKSSGAALLAAFLGKEEPESRGYPGYELKELQNDE